MEQGLPPVISLTGVGQVGKSEVARYLKERYGYGGDHINEPMVAMAVPLLERMGCTREDALSRLVTARKAEPIPGYEWLSGRRILQAIGYDLRNALGRLTDPDADVVDEGFFLDMWERRHSGYERLVNESARYPVEIDWSEDRGGVVIQIDAAGARPANGHVSETRSLPYDYPLFNDFDGLPGLHAKVDAVLAQWRDPANPPYDLAERRQLRMFTDEPGTCFRIDGEVRRDGGSARTAFERLEAEMEDVLVARARQRFRGDEAKVAELREWLDRQRGLERMRAALVIAHYGVPEFNARFASLRRQDGRADVRTGTPPAADVAIDRPDVVRVARPASMEQDVGTTLLIATSQLADGRWSASWGTAGQAMTEIPTAHATREDAVVDARRRYAASVDPEAEGDEFDEGEHADALDAEIRYAALLLDDENRWRGRWYRGEWTGEGAYTDLLYDTPGQARRAARRLRTTGDES
jgi:hypothetical protein